MAVSPCNALPIDGVLDVGCDGGVEIWFDLPEPKDTPGRGSNQSNITNVLKSYKASPSGGRKAKAYILNFIPYINYIISHTDLKAKCQLKLQPNNNDSKTYQQSLSIYLELFPERDRDTKTETETETTWSGPTAP